MPTKRILFVDDEAAILDGLRNVFRKDRKRWDMVFALGGAEALAELERGPCDVIVSDMRMPGMDGAALLTEVKRRYPGMARLMLSGHAEREAILRALPVVHRFMAKPCDTNELRTAIDRACELQLLLGNEILRGLVGGLDSIPSPPRTYIALTEVAANPDSNLADVAEIVESDAAMSTRVLQLANSAYFGTQQSVVSVAQAVTYLGLELVRCLALTAHVFAMAETLKVPGLSLDALHDEALRAAKLAKSFLAESPRRDEAFTAALVHDVGHVVLAVSRPDDVAEISACAAATGRPWHELEVERFGVSHAEVGGYLLGVWGLPFALVETAAFHHRPTASPGSDHAVLAAVHVADALATGDPDAAVDVEFLTRAGFADRLPSWRAIAREALRP